MIVGISSDPRYKICGYWNENMTNEEINWKKRLCNIDNISANNSFIIMQDIHFQSLFLTKQSNFFSKAFKEFGSDLINHVIHLSVQAVKIETCLRQRENKFKITFMLNLINISVYYTTFDTRRKWKWTPNLITSFDINLNKSLFKLRPKRSPFLLLKHDLFLLIHLRTIYEALWS